MKLTARTGERLLEIVVGRSQGVYTVEVDGQRREIDVHKLEGDFYSLLMGGRSYEVSIETAGNGYLVRHGASVRRVDFADPARGAREGFGAADGPLAIEAQMPGKIVRVLVEEGQQVAAGDGLLVLEAMKMENEIAAERDGTVGELSVVEGQTVEAGTTLVVLE